MLWRRALLVASLNTTCETGDKAGNAGIIHHQHASIIYESFYRQKWTKSEKQYDENCPYRSLGPSAKYDQFIRVYMKKINENENIRSVKNPI
jgi:hypothetical protein